MRILVFGCSFSSGWRVEQSWSDILATEYGHKVDCMAENASSNTDIFLKVLSQRVRRYYDLVLVQWSGINRISVSPTPQQEKILLNNINHSMVQNYLPGLSTNEIENASKVISLLNNDYKHFNDFVAMCKILSHEDNIAFINGLLPWDIKFFSDDIKSSEFFNQVVDVRNLPDNLIEQYTQELKEQVASLYNEVLWVNLTHSWMSQTIDTVDSIDLHPGPKSQIVFAQQVQDYITQRFNL